MPHGWCHTVRLVTAGMGFCILHGIIVTAAADTLLTHLHHAYGCVDGDHPQDEPELGPALQPALHDGRREQQEDDDVVELRV